MSHADRDIAHSDLIKLDLATTVESLSSLERASGVRGLGIAITLRGAETYASLPLTLRGVRRFSQFHEDIHDTRILAGGGVEKESVVRKTNDRRYGSALLPGSRSEERRVGKEC